MTGTTSFVYDGDGARVLLVKPDGSQTGYVGGLVEIDFPAPTGGTRIKDITFEDGSLTHPTSGADTVTGGVTLNSTTPLKGAYSASLPNVSSAYLTENFTGVDEVYVSFYLKVNALPSSDARIAFFSNQGTTVGVILLRTTGALRLRNGSTTIGSDSAALTVGTLYRVGLRQKKGTGSNAILEAYLATGEAAFGSAFASTTSGTWTTQADRLRFGATTGTLDGVFDNLRLDSGSMPGAGFAPGTLSLASYTRPSLSARIMSKYALGIKPVARARLFVPPTGQVWRSYYYAGGQRIAMRVEGAPSNNGVFYLLSDHLGSTSVTADANGNLVSVLRYYPYGQTRYTSGETPTTYRYTGQRSDESSTGLYFYGARYYDALIGRFISADTMVPEPGNPQSLNRYAYTYNNPLKYTDPTGHCAEPVSFLICMTIIGAGVATVVDWIGQVAGNLNEGQPLSEAVYHENLDEKSMTVSAVSGGVGTLAFTALGPTTLAGSFAAGSFSGVAAGQVGAVADASWEQVASAANGRGPRDDQFAANLQTAGFMNPGTMIADGISGGVVGGASHGLSKFIPVAGAQSTVKGPPVVVGPLPKSQGTGWNIQPLGRGLTFDERLLRGNKYFPVLNGIRSDLQSLLEESIGGITSDWLDR